MGSSTPSMSGLHKHNESRLRAASLLSYQQLRDSKQLNQLLPLGQALLSGKAKHLPDDSVGFLGAFLMRVDICEDGPVIARQPLLHQGHPTSTLSQVEGLCTHFFVLHGVLHVLHF